MGEEKKPCIYEAQVRIGETKWRWCSAFNAKMDDLNCEDCRLRSLVDAERSPPPRPGLLLV